MFGFFEKKKEQPMSGAKNSIYKEGSYNEAQNKMEIKKAYKEAKKPKRTFTQTLRQKYEASAQIRREAIQTAKQTPKTIVRYGSSEKRIAQEFFGKPQKIKTQRMPATKIIYVKKPQPEFLQEKKEIPSWLK